MTISPSDKQNNPETVVLPAAAPHKIQIDRRTLATGVMGILVAGGYALLVTGLSLTIHRSLFIENPFLIAAVFFLLALALFPLRNALETRINRLLFRGKVAHQEALTQVNTALATQFDLNTIITILRENVANTLQPDGLHIFLFQARSAQFQACADQTQQPTSQLIFAPGGPLPQILFQHSQGFVYDPAHAQRNLGADEARVRLLGAQIYMPIRGRQGLLGWLALGRRSDGAPYLKDDLAYLKGLADLASLAIERVQMVHEMEQQVQEMNVLTRVAQGVNITIALDDLYELIYAQTTQIIAADEFRIFLGSGDGAYLQQAFFSRGSERISAEENQGPIAAESLEMEVFRSAHSFVCADYQLECRERNAEPFAAEALAWMAAPLNAGANPVGLITLARNEPAARYSADQLATLQAIADQTAGAIVKARLLQETENRAHQLRVLNEVTRQLTATFDQDLLLNNILSAAVEILKCEAGSLLMLDATSGELVFQVTIGPVANSLKGSRMPADAGVVGRAMQTRQAVLVNDVRASKDWFAVTDQETGFMTRSLMVTPLIIKNEPIGAIEVVNRRDGAWFAPGDEELLSAFAAQAGVAIENARLYTMTDKALNERVEELSTMQRIDRDLNSGLDAERVMRLTLDWALRRTGADAGLIAVADEDGLRVVATHGYADGQLALQEGLLPEAEWKPYIGESEVKIEHSAEGWLNEVQSRTFVPIRREKVLLGLLVLESQRADWGEKSLVEFLERLGDHAAVALANAQLYKDIQAANLAKSEFVSFVAHELKNPMTSIKGYTDLLAAKAVGPINDAQANFLAVIRSNTDRMNSLVSDLNDLSKIEAGRMRLDYARLSLNELVAEVDRSARKQIEEKQQAFNVDIPADCWNIWADRTRLTQILVNLVSNATKYTEPGGTIFLGAKNTIEDGAGAAPLRMVHVWVQDTGIGISPEDQQKVFQKFFRAEDPKTRETPGTGLGLNITRSLVEMQGGRIWFESVFRQGTTFHVLMPVAED
jgi:signal transduction histidine kinase